MVSRLPRGRFRHGPHCRRSSSPCPSALAAFAIALAVVATTFLAIDVGLIFDCCVPLPPEEDHCLPPPSGKALAWPSSPSFVDCCRRRRRTPPLPHHSFASAASWSPSLFTPFLHPHIQRNWTTARKKQEMYFFREICPNTHCAWAGGTCASFPDFCDNHLSCNLLCLLSFMYFISKN